MYSVGGNKTVHLKNIHDRLFQNTFLRHNAIFFLGSLVVSIVNYAYYPVLGRLLNIEQYGEVQVLISFFLQLTLLLAVLSQVTVNVVANHTDKGKQDRLIFELEKLAVMAGAATLVVGVTLSPVIGNALKFESPAPFIILLLAFISTIPFTFRSAFLRGQQQFGQVSLGNVIVALGKLVGAVILVMIGLGVNGAIGGLIIAQLIAFAYIATRARQRGFPGANLGGYFSKPDMKLLLPELKYALFVLGVSLAIVILSSIDVIAVKYFFDATTAGGYAGIATVAKIIFFLTASVAQVMLPVVKLDRPSGENRKFLLKSFLILAVLGGSVSVGFAVAPEWVVTILMGQTYAPYAHLLPILGLALFLVSVINLVASYYMALRRYRIIGVMGAGVALTLGLLLTRHENLTMIVQSMAIAAAALLGMIVMWRVALEMRTRKNNE